MPMQVVNNPSATAQPIVRQSQPYRRRRYSDAPVCIFCAGLPAGLRRGYAQDGTPSGALFSLAFGRFDGASGSRINNTTTQLKQ